MKIKLSRGGIWFSSVYLDEVHIKLDEEYHQTTMDDWGGKSFYQKHYELEKLGYELEDLGNNPLSKTEQFSYIINDFSDRIIVYKDFSDKTQLVVVKQLMVDKCDTTTSIELIHRITSLNKLHRELVDIFTVDYGVRKTEVLK